MLVLSVGLNTLSHNVGPKTLILLFLMHPGGKADDGAGSGALPTIWETLMEFRAPALSLTNPNYCRHVGNELVNEIPLFLSLPLSNPPTLATLPFK